MGICRDSFRYHLKCFAEEKDSKMEQREACSPNGSKVAPYMMTTLVALFKNRAYYQYAG